MKSRFVFEGEGRLKNSPEFRAKLQALKEAIAARYVSEMAAAGPFKRALLWVRIQRDFLRERRQLTPSSRSLYTSPLAARCSIGSC